MVGHSTSGGRPGGTLTLPLKSRRARAAPDHSLEPGKIPDKKAMLKPQQAHPVKDEHTAASMLELKKRAHRFYKLQYHHQSQKQLGQRIREGPPVDPFDSFPIRSTPDVPRMAQYYVQVLLVRAT